jgi:glycosyltransferase involved in cell wall biosynthesis
MHVQPVSCDATRPLKVSIIWHGLPAYAARLVRSIVGREDIELTLIGTDTPARPAYLQEIVGQPIHWVGNAPTSPLLNELAQRPMDLCLTTGWAFAPCKRFAAIAKARGAQICSMIDNRWRGDLRQRIGKAYFQLFLRNAFDYAWVPGASASKLCAYLGVPQSRIVTGLYGSDSSLFMPPTNIGNRPLRIGFVGQHIPRKGLDVLLEAFRRFYSREGSYELHLYGDGELRGMAESTPGVLCHPFSDPEQIAAAMQSFRIFVMPSRDDNWPLALHEAALSGCTLLTTHEVGNTPELITSENGVVVRSGDPEALAQGLLTLAQWSDEQRVAAARVSRHLAESFGPDRWRREFLGICSRLQCPR